MSLILEALKKIDSDKSRHLQKTDIAAAILRSDGKAGRSKVLWIAGLSVSTALFLIAAGAGISYFLLAGQKTVKPALMVHSDLPPKPAVPRPTGTALERPPQISLEPFKPMQAEVSP